MNCPECGYPLSEHVGGKACLPAAKSTVKSIYDLPIFGWAWSQDGKDTLS